ncbi:uncharacterized protein LOC144167521 [Haemaphysalis longicornis]
MDNPGHSWEGEQLGAFHCRSLPPPLCPAPAARAERRTPPSRFVCLRCVSFACPLSDSSTRGRRVDAVCLDGALQRRWPSSQAAGEISSVENPKYEDSDAQRFICAGYRGG